MSSISTTIQTQYRASPVLSTIDINSIGFAHPNKASHLTSPSKLSPYASPYKPRANLPQNEQMYRARARVGAVGAGGGRGSQPTSSMHLNLIGGAVEPVFHKLPSYHQSSRFDPFGDLTVSDSQQPFSHSRQPKPKRTGAAAQTYTHFYYYDKTTNSPTLAYGSAPTNSASMINRASNASRNNKSRHNNQFNQHHKIAYHNNSDYNLSQRHAQPTVVNSFVSSGHTSYSPSLSLSTPPRTLSRSPSPPGMMTSPNRPAFPVHNNNKAGSMMTTLRRSPSPPSPTTTTSSILMKPPQVQLPPSTITLSSPPPPPVKKPAVKTENRLTLSKLVAAMMLNRVDAMGRSRCAAGGVKRAGCGSGYVKSGLSRVAWVE